jgi:hypothetical protein
MNLGNACFAESFDSERQSGAFDGKNTKRLLSAFHLYNLKNHLHTNV